MPAVGDRGVEEPLVLRSGVMADDLTGALDAGLQAWKRSCRVRVLIARESGAAAGGGGLYAPIAEGAGVVVLDTESRSLGIGDSRTRVAAALDALRNQGIPLSYKKVDSTLRGNVGGELEAVIGAGGVDAVLLAPVLPRAGRVVRDGVLTVGGVRLSETEMAQDPLWPIATSVVAEIVAQQTALATALVPLDAVRRSPQALLEAIGRSIGEGARVLVADAETEEDLVALAWACGRLRPRVLPCGSAGLFAHVGLAHAGSPGVTADGSADGRARRPVGPVLVVSGSMSQVSREQLAIAGLEADAKVLRPEPGRLFGAVEDAARERERLASEVALAVAREKVVLLDGASMSRAELYAASGGSQAERARRARLTLEALVTATSRVAGTIGGLVLVGGDTAVAVCRSLGAKGIDLTGEVEPLVPRGSILGGALDGMEVVTKAGGLGSSRAVAEAILTLRSSCSGRTR